MSTIPNKSSAVKYKRDMLLKKAQKIKDLDGLKRKEALREVDSEVKLILCHLLEADHFAKICLAINQGLK